MPDADVVDGAEEPDAGCGDIDALGHCQGDILRACVDGRLTEYRCPERYGVGFTCQLSEGLGAAQCVHVTSDAGVSELDAGAGNVDAGTRLPEDTSSSCVKLTPGNAGFISSVGLVVVGRRRKRHKGLDA